MQRQNKSKKKEKIKEIVKVTKPYRTRSVEKKFMGDSIKANTFATDKRRKLKKGIMIEKENMEVVEVGVGDEKIDIDVVVETKKKKKEA